MIVFIIKKIKKIYVDVQQYVLLGDIKCIIYFDLNVVYFD